MKTHLKFLESKNSPPPPQSYGKGLSAFKSNLRELEKIEEAIESFERQNNKDCATYYKLTSDTEVMVYRFFKPEKKFEEFLELRYSIKLQPRCCN
ncbi:MAG: hypothetical protein IAF38_01940 [Bacteroidia bacterium]|nr:hypothetical protein [Bacteroidia bacterium]